MTAPPEPRGAAAPDDVPAYRYDNRLAATIETRWQRAWEERGTYLAPNPVGPLAGVGAESGRPRSFVLDMFPYPSGSGLHVGHPLGYIGTDVYARFLRMRGHNVLHALGYDAFGLPAEQYAVQTGEHPRASTETNIRNIRQQLRRLGLGHDGRRSIATIDPDYYRWTQWIFLQIYNSWYDPDANRARPIDDLEAQFVSGDRPTSAGRPWDELNATEQAEELNAHRLAYISEAPVNWCPGLGTVLANEEVTPDGRSERGNFPVFRRSLRQWMMRITAYADRLIADLDLLEWPERIKAQQRNWIGRSEGARVDFSVAGSDETITVFTTRPDTLWGATYMVLAPEHPSVDRLVADRWPEGTHEAWTGGAETPSVAVAAYRHAAARKSDVERQANVRDKSGVFTGALAINPTNGESIPVFIADYVLMGYGTGAIMSVPAHDERDFAFARAFALPIRCVVEPTDGRGTDTARWTEAFLGDEAALSDSANDQVSLNGLSVAEAKRVVTDWLVGTGQGEGTVNFKLRDWLFSRQRYWGEPFPIVYDRDGVAHALPEAMLPIELPEVDDYSPRTFEPDAADTDPESPLSRAREWVEVTLDLGDGPQPYRRETNTMPNWAGSCWYELRYLDPTNSERLVDPEVERYWMGPTADKPAGGVDLYVGGAEHAVLHLLYARFWHKVLFDLGHVSSAEPFHRLVNQGMIQAYVYRDARGFPVPAADVVAEDDGTYTYEGQPVDRKLGKMGKSLKNGVSPEEICEAYGADTLRLYEMAMGPLDISRPWDTTSVVGPYRFLQRLWRNIIDEETGGLRVVDEQPDPDTLRALHRTIDGVGADMAALRFNTAIAKATEFNNHLAKTGVTPRVAADALVALIAPLAPHIAEELWAKLGHEGSVVWAPYPQADPDQLVAEMATYAVQVKGKLRATIDLPVDVAEEDAVAQARALERVAGAIGEAPIRRTIFIRDRTINFVV